MFDKSQQFGALVTEWFVEELLGVRDIDLKRFIAAQLHGVVLDYRHGLKIEVIYQRKSGLGNTMPGNIVVNLVSLSSAADIPPDFIYIVIVGDDILIAVWNWLDTSEVTSKMADTYNLIAKALTVDQGYFCSEYVVHTPRGIKFLRDPIKAVTSLGRCDASDEDKLRENFISFKDSLAGYDDLVNLRHLDRAVCTRLKFKKTIMPMLIALYTLTTSFGYYRRLFSKNKKQTEY